MRAFILGVALAISTNCLAFEHGPITRDFSNTLSAKDTNQMAERTDTALDNLVRFAIKRLMRDGYLEQATRYQLEWDNKYRGFLSAYVKAYGEGRFGDIGDYAPLSEWLSNFYKDLEALVGEPVLKVLHLDDINTLNYTIPVVFHITRVLGNIQIDSAEYEKHFDPFAGVVTYWLIWGGCEIVTWGGGWFVICTPAAMAGEYIVVNYVAPKFSNDWYNYFWQP